MHNIQFFFFKNQLLLFLHIPEFFNCLSSDEYFSFHLNLLPKHAAQNSSFSAKHISQKLFSKFLPHWFITRIFVTYSDYLLSHENNNIKNSWISWKKYVFQIGDVFSIAIIVTNQVVTWWRNFPQTSWNISWYIINLNSF